MAVSHHQYTEIIVQHLYGILEAEQDKGKAREFEIRVDNTKVVPRTPALTLFHSFTEFIRPQTHRVTIILFRNRSQHNDKYILYLKNSLFPSQELGSTEAGLDEKINSKLKEQEKNYQLEGLKKQNRKLFRKLKNKKKYIVKLEETILENKAQRLNIGKINLGELSSYALEGILRRNTQLIAGIPGGKALAGAIDLDNDTKAKALEGPSNQPPPEGKASFQVESTQEAPGLSSEQELDLATGQQIRTGFSENQISKIQDVLSLLAARPDLIKQTVQFLTHKITQSK